VGLTAGSASSVRRRSRVLGRHAHCAHAGRRPRGGHDGIRLHGERATPDTARGTRGRVGATGARLSDVEGAVGGESSVPAAHRRHRAPFQRTRRRSTPVPFTSARGGRSARSERAPTRHEGCMDVRQQLVAVVEFGRSVRRSVTAVGERESRSRHFDIRPSGYAGEAAGGVLLRGSSRGTRGEVPPRGRESVN